MAQETAPAQTKAPWTKIFTSFKIALDLKKMLLAAAGILLVFAGWWLLSLVFYSARTKPPYHYTMDQKDPKDPAVLKAEWDRFKTNRNSWNLMHELAGPPGDLTPVDAGDVANTREEFILLSKWKVGISRANDPIVVREKEKAYVLEVEGAPELKSHTLTLVPDNDAAKLELPKLKDKKLKLLALVVHDKTNRIIRIDGVQVKVEGPFEKLSEYREEALSMQQIEEQAKAAKAENTYDNFRALLVAPRPKVSGLMRVSPWSENRGENPYLVVARAIKTRGESLVGDGRFVATFVKDDVPVLIEPLVKFLLPVVYLFDPAAGVWERLYLILALLWSLVVWGFFGGAIARIAAVQFARNERITLRDAVKFTKERFVSYIAAPVFPLVLVAFLTLLLMIFGWIEWIPYFIGDIFAGLLWPIVIVFGFVMTIVLVGMVGWPLMVATISTEGTDSFDAMSRSYSYVYQAPWQYLWYSFVAVVYGAAVVFFIGFMASMMVFMGKWGVSSAYGLADTNPKTDRDPSYLFYYAPTSFGWRDHLISSSNHVEEKTVLSYDGRLVRRIEFKEEYERELRLYEKTGAALMVIWIWPLFLLVVGFGYSFFWSASTVIYFLMRKHVDDTELDEVHVEDEELDDPFLKQPPSPAPTPAPPPAAPKPGTVSLNLVDAPPSTAIAPDVPPPQPPPPPENPPAP